MRIKGKFWTLLLSLITISESSGASTRLGSDELRITPLNRDDCLAKLICGISVVSIQDERDVSMGQGQIYGEYATILSKFFADNPVEGEEETSLSQESVEALEDYSVSEEEEETISKIKKNRIPSPTPIRKTVTTTTTTTQKPRTTKPTPAIVQIWDMGRPIQESTKRNPKISVIFQNNRISRARKIMKQAGIEAKLRTVRQCQKISGCTYTFKQLYQKYGGKGEIDETQQPQQVLPVVEENLSREPKPEKETKIKVLAETNWQSYKAKKPTTEAPLEEPDLGNFDYGTLNGGITQAGLEGFLPLPTYKFPSASPSTSSYKVKKNTKTQTLTKTKSKKTKRVSSTTTESPKTDATTLSTTLSTTTIATTIPTNKPSSTTTEQTRGVVHYKNPNRRKRPPVANKNVAEDDDENGENINETRPVKIVHNPQVDPHDDEEEESKKDEVEYEDDASNESADDYDEEAKFQRPVDYGNDDENSDEDDDEEDVKPGVLHREKNKKKPQKSTKNRPKQSQKQEKPVEPEEKPQVIVPKPKKTIKKKGNKITSEFLSIQTGKLKNVKSKNKKNEDNEDDDDDVDDDDVSKESEEEDDFRDDKIEQVKKEKSKPVWDDTQTLTQIGGRPISPDYDVSITMSAITRSRSQGMRYPGAPPPYRPTTHSSQAKEKKAEKEEKKKLEGRNSWSQSSSSGDQSKPQESQKFQFQNPSHENFGYHYKYQKQDAVMPSMSSGLSVFSPVKSLFKHITNGIATGAQPHEISPSHGPSGFTRIPHGPTGHKGQQNNKNTPHLPGGGNRPMGFQSEKNRPLGENRPESYQNNRAPQHEAQMRMPHLRPRIKFHEALPSRPSPYGGFVSEKTMPITKIEIPKGPESSSFNRDKYKISKSSKSKKKAPATPPVL